MLQRVSLCITGRRSGPRASERGRNSPNTQARRAAAAGCFCSSLAAKSRLYSSNPINRKLSDDEKKIEEDGKVLPGPVKARAIVESRKSGTYTTVSLAKEDGQRPLFGSLMPYITLQQRPGNLIFALRKDEKHYAHLEKVTKSSFMIYPLTPAHIKPKELPLPKVNLTGISAPLEDPADIDAAMEKFALMHPGSEKFLKDEKLFVFYEFEPDEVLLARSSAAVEQYLASDYIRAPVDPIARQSRPILDKINANFQNELKTLCLEYGDVAVDEVFIMGLDRFGFDMFGRQSDGGSWLEFRFPLDKEIVEPSEYLNQIEATCKNVQFLSSTKKSGKSQ